MIRRMFLRLLALAVPGCYLSVVPEPELGFRFSSVPDQTEFDPLEGFE